MKGYKFAGYAVGTIAAYDLAFGRSGTPLPVLGDYLTQELDVVLLVAAGVLLYLGYK